jgi:hypothetical protein
MAVKVMVAPAIARGELSLPQATRRGAAPSPAGGEKRPRRRRSAVYDAEGNEVFITLMCLKCHRMRPLSQFGLRRMSDGAIRNQPWCRTCRSDASPKSRREPAETAEPSGAAEPVATPGPAAAAPAAPPSADAGILATQVATALYRGRG